MKKHCTWCLNCLYWKFRVNIWKSCFLLPLSQVLARWENRSGTIYWCYRNKTSFTKELFPQICFHFFILYLSYKEVWEPCGVIWHFVIRLIKFPAGSSPSNLPHRHTTPHECTRAFHVFLKFMGQWEVDTKDSEKLHLHRHEINKRTTKCTTNEY